MRNHIVKPFAILGMLTLALQGLSQSVTTNAWTGNGDSNASGNWTASANWAGGNVPNTTNEVAELGNVTSGTRTVTVDASNAVFRVIWNQTSAATNVLDLQADLTVTSKHIAWEPANAVNPFGAEANAAYGPACGVLNLNGKALRLTGDVRSSVEIANTVNMTAGSILSPTASNSTTGNGLFFTGILNINAPGGTVVSQSGANSPMEIGIRSTGVMNLKAGTYEIKTTQDYERFALLSIYSGGTASITTGTVVRLQPSATFSGKSAAAIVNEGTFNQGGQITLRPSNPPSTGIYTNINGRIDNSGTWNVVSTNALINGNRYYGTTYAYGFFNNASGTLAGHGTLRWLDSQTATNRLSLTQAGTVAPGNAGVGVLTLTNMNVTAMANSVLAIEVNGPGSADKLVLSTGALNLAASDDVLDVALLGGFSPTTFRATILQYESRTGAFDEIVVDGTSNPSRWTVEYGATSADLVLLPPSGTVILAK